MLKIYCCLNASPTLDPQDAVVIEQALRLAEEYGGSVTAVGMGTADAQQSLVQALAMGCDDALWIDNETQQESARWAVLAQALQQQIFELLLVSPYSLSGRKDGPGRLAEYLHLPLLPYATEIQWRPGVLNGLCQVEDELLRTECPTPAIASVASNLSPRLPKLSAIVRAKKMPISRITVADSIHFGESCLVQHSVEGTRRKLIFDQEANALEVFIDALKEEIGLVKGMDKQ